MTPAARDERAWLWFAAWSLVGAGYALSILGALTIGPFVLPLPVLATIGLILYRPARAGAPGLISGLSGPVFLVAFLNRDGPGTVCVTTATSESCSEQWSPWPFLGVAVALLVAGIAVMVASRTSRAGPPNYGRPSRPGWEAGSAGTGQ